MLRGLYTAASGMQAQMLRQQTLADNLANINTSGFKGAENVYRSYDDQVIGTTATGAAIGQISRGVDVHGTNYDLRQGAMRQTANPLDFAVSGPGFFAVQNAGGGVEYTRNGHFNIDANGFLVTQEGNKVLDSGQMPIFIGPNAEDITVLRKGELHVNGDYKTMIGVFDFPQGTNLVRTDSDKYRSASSSQSMISSNVSTIQQGFLEGSNVSSVKAATDMIQVMRSYEANQKILGSQIDTLNMLMDVGRI